MEELFGRLSRKAERLGKHYERYLITAAAHHRQLVERLEQRAQLDEVDLWSLCPTPAEQIVVVRDAGSDQREKLDFLAAYYSLQFLHLNLMALDRLELALSEVHRRRASYRQFLQSMASNYQRLNSAYIDSLLSVYAGDTALPVFTLCVVGTRWDQDDVDILLVHEEGCDPAALNKAFGKVVAEFFKRAGRLHMYIAERVGLPGFSATVEQYAESLEHNITDFVMISELLSAEPLLGDERLFKAFRRSVLSRFYGKTSRCRRYHEGFLRGLLGEMHSLLVSDVREDRIDFKSDALRLAKGMALVIKVVNNLRDIPQLDVLYTLSRTDDDQADQYRNLGNSLLWIETFRLLYQVMEVQEEEVELGETPVSHLDRVAAIMGYKVRGGVSPSNQLILKYFESVEMVRSTSGELLEGLQSYVSETSLYARLEPEKNVPRQRKRNVARELADSVSFFSGHIFFDDVLAALRKDGGGLAAQLVDDTMKLSGRRRKAIIDGYLAFAASDPMTLFELMVTIQAVPGPRSQRLFDAMVQRLFEHLEEEDGLVPGILDVYGTRPELVNRFIEKLSRPQRIRLESLLDQELWDEDEQRSLDQLKHYIWLRTGGSEFYRRIFRRVVDRNPQFIHHIQDVDQIMKFSQGFLASAEDGTTTIEHRKDALASYYDVAYLGCAIKALKGAPLDAYRLPFIEFADKYVSTLYGLCKKLAAEKTGTKVETRDLFALFASGGYARAQAFDDDYDLILVLNSDDETIYELFKTVSMCMHRELVKRGTIPQYRFSDHFGQYVTRFSQLRQLFDSGQADAVDMTQLLGSRMLVGSSRLLERMQKEIIENYVFSDATQFAGRVVEEMRLRQQSYVAQEELINIKEGPGGLRDIEQVLLMLKARHRVTEPISSTLFDLIREIHQNYSAEIEQLRSSHAFLRRVRDVYRLTVAADDDIYLEHLEPVAGIMEVTSGQRGDPARLFQMIRRHMSHVTRIVDALVEKVCLKPSPPVVPRVDFRRTSA